MPHSTYAHRLGKPGPRVPREEETTPDFAANLSMAFLHTPLMERFDEAARAGFRAVDVTFPYEISQQVIARKLRDSGLTLVTFNLPGGVLDREGGGICDPAQRAAFREGVRRAIDYAAAVGCRLLNCPTAEPPIGIEAETACEMLIDNLRFAAQQAKPVGVRILLAAADASSLPRGLVLDTARAIAILDAVGARNTGLLYNVDAMALAGEPVEAMIARHLPRIGHIQIVRGGEGAAGAKDHYEFFDFVETIGHGGWIGCGSAESIEASLLWMARDHSTRIPSRWGMPLEAFRKRA